MGPLPLRKVLKKFGVGIGGGTGQDWEDPTLLAGVKVGTRFRVRVRFRVGLIQR